MAHCNKCNLKVVTSNKHCPLCQSKLITDNSAITEIFPSITPKFKSFPWLLRSLIFFSITACVVSVLLNLLLPKSGYWSVIVILSVISMWVIIKSCIKRIRCISRTILYQIIMISTLVFFIDFLYGFQRWSINYVIPSLFVSCIFAITIVGIIMTKKDFDDYLIYVIITSILGLLPLIFALTPVTTVKWPSLSCAAINIIFLAGFWLFSKKDFIEEIKKRFHI